MDDCLYKSIMLSMMWMTATSRVYVCLTSLCVLYNVLTTALNVFYLH